MKRFEPSIWMASGAVAVSLLVLAGLYLGRNVWQDRQITGRLKSVTQRLERLARRDPYPNRENTRAAMQEGKRLRNFLQEVAVHFAPSPRPPVLNNMEFRAYLDNTVARLRSEADRSGVEVPPDYWFSFAAQKGMVSFSPTTLEPLTAQLSEISALCQVLFDAKVNSLSWLKRAPVEKEDSLGAQDYLNAKPLTNAFQELMPYEVAFQGFSSQLAAVLEGLGHLPQCFIVTNPMVEPAESERMPTEPNGSSPERFQRHPIAPPIEVLGDRSRLHSTRGLRSHATAARPGPTVILSERLLRFILSIQAVRVRSRELRVAAEPGDSANALPFVPEGVDLLKLACAKIKALDGSLVSDDIEMGKAWQTGIPLDGWKRGHRIG